MAISMMLDVADQLFPLGNDKNPAKASPTHISQVPDEEISAAVRESERKLELLCTLTGPQARQKCLPRKDGG